MRSIRLSLIFCFLLLLVVALGLVSVLVYQSAERSLEEKQSSMRELLLARYHKHCEQEKKKLDELLLADARSLTNVIKVQVQWVQFRPQPLLALGILSAALGPQAHLQIPFWLAQSNASLHPRNQVGGKVAQMLPPPPPLLKLKDMTLPPNFEPQVTRYFQINTANGDRWQSPSMEDLSFDFDPTLFDKDKSVDWVFDDVEVEGLGRLRRVQYMLSRFSITFPPAPRWPNARIPPSRSGSEKTKSTGEKKAKTGATWNEPKAKAGSLPGVTSPKLTIFIQGACTTEKRDAALVQYQQDWHQDLLNLDAESAEVLGELRSRLLVVTGIAFVIALVGGCLIVGASLKPLRRLGEAVSQVSEKDFRLSVAGASLPVELRPIAERMQSSLTALERAFAREKQAAADISHELRTPLAALMTMIELALRKPRSAEDYRELLQDCHSAGQQMTQLVERMLALARLDAGSDHLRPREVDVSHLAQQCATLVRPLAEARGLTLHCQPGTTATLTTDPDKLREVLTNLLHNAIEYNRPSGSVDLCVARENGHLKLEVQDTGVGIPADAREHIFERFYRADASRHTSSNDRLHAGIGLAIVKAYIELMGGDISVSSEVGVGSTFRVTLPVK